MVGVNPYGLTEAQAVRMILSRAVKMVKETEHGSCANYYLLCREQGILNASKEDYSKIHADLRKIEVEREARAEVESTSEQKSRRDRMAELWEKATMIAHTQLNRSRETIERFEQRLEKERIMLNYIQTAYETIEEVIDEKVKKENYVMRVSRICYHLQFLQEIKNTKP